MCLPDAVAQAHGTTWPGCACTYVAPQAATLARNKSQGLSRAIMDKVVALQRQLTPEAQRLLRNLTGGDVLAGLDGWNLSAPVQCPAGSRCSRYAFLGLAGQLSRRSAGLLQGICAPCQIGEYW